MFLRIMKILIAVLFVVNTALFIICCIVPINTDANATRECPLQFFDNKVYWSKVSDYASCGNNLYLLYDFKKVLAVYDLNGRYLHSFLFEMPDKGVSKLHIGDGMLFVESTDHSLYEFIDGSFSKYYDREHNALQVQQLRESFEPTIHDNKSNSYALRYASVWRIEQNGTATKVIHRSPWLVILQYDVIFCIVHLICIVSGIFLFGKIKRR